MNIVNEMEREIKRTRSGNMSLVDGIRQLWKQLTATNKYITYDEDWLSDEDAKKLAEMQEASEKREEELKKQLVQSGNNDSTKANKGGKIRKQGGVEVQKIEPVMQKRAQRDSGRAMDDEGR